MRRNARARNNRKKIYSDIDFNKTRKFLIIIIGILAVIFIAVITFSTLKNHQEYKNLINTSKNEIEKQNDEENKETENQNSSSEETDTTFTLSAIGNILCNSTLTKDAYIKSNNSYDFSYIFNNINSYTKLADICVGNLETTFSGSDKGFLNSSKLNAPDELSQELKHIGVDVLSTSSMHSLDFGYDGLSRTIDTLNSADVSHLGTYNSSESQDKVLIKYAKGVKIAFLNFTYGNTNLKLPTDKNYCVNLYSEDFAKKQIDIAKSKSADVIVTCMNWTNVKESKQQETADFLFKNGVNVILGSGPQSLQKMEKRTVTLDDNSTKDGFIIYSLGNFLVDSNEETYKNSIILNLSITKHSNGEITIDKTDYKPIYISKDSNNSSQKFKIIDINKIIYNYDNHIDTSITDKFYNSMKTKSNEINKLLNP